MKIVITTTVTTKPVKNDVLSEVIKNRLSFCFGHVSLISYDKGKDVTEQVFLSEVNVPENWFKND